MGGRSYPHCHLNIALNIAHTAFARSGGERWQAAGALAAHHTRARGPGVGRGAASRRCLQ